MSNFETILVQVRKYHKRSKIKYYERTKLVKDLIGFLYLLLESDGKLPFEAGRRKHPICKRKLTSI